ncbi:GNAT family N-acetyltransferase [Neokomagataea sp. TBRC 2177]|uniref:GNAT family N-acetyltransferase n=1 Tax=Neokomagataea anthophila TaxID=2826925 RepID=A0ABS5E5J9_9PROT|nr:GNAT family N-acetyltransferase [Neokomagataea anthophila]
MVAYWLRACGPTTRLDVDVTFLELLRGGTDVPPLPEGLVLTRLAPSAVGLYRRLYRDVGAAYCWWMRRKMPEDALAALLSDPERFIMVLHDRQGAPLGFYELHHVSLMVSEIAYFGLLPCAIGHGLGRFLLERAVAHAFCLGVSKLEVNTCTLDHPRALPNYKKVGFQVTRVIRERWDVPQECLPTQGE